MRPDEIQTVRPEPVEGFAGPSTSSVRTGLKTSSGQIKKTKWDVDGPLLWGYFFLDPNSEKLKAVAADLEASGFRVVGIAKVAAKQAWRLHVERIEAHTPASLNARNNDLYLFAEKHSLASYDAMDVGPAPAGAK